MRDFALRRRIWLTIVLAAVISIACGISDVKRMTKEELKAMPGDANLVVVGSPRTPP